MTPHRRAHGERPPFAPAAQPEALKRGPGVVGGAVPHADLPHRVKWLPSAKHRAIARDEDGLAAGEPKERVLAQGLGERPTEDRGQHRLRRQRVDGGVRAKAYPTFEHDLRGRHGGDPHALMKIDSESREAPARGPPHRFREPRQDLASRLDQADMNVRSLHPAIRGQGGIDQLANGARSGAAAGAATDNAKAQHGVPSLGILARFGGFKAFKDPLPEVERVADVAEREGMVEQALHTARAWCSIKRYNQCIVRQAASLSRLRFDLDVLRVRFDRARRPPDKLGGRTEPPDRIDDVARLDRAADDVGKQRVEQEIGFAVDQCHLDVGKLATHPFEPHCSVDAGEATAEHDDMSWLICCDRSAPPSGTNEKQAYQDRIGETVREQTLAKHDAEEDEREQQHNGEWANQKPHEQQDARQRLHDRGQQREGLWHHAEGRQVE